MHHTRIPRQASIPAALATITLLTACGSGGQPAPIPAATLPQLAAASGAKIDTCTTLASRFSYADTTISAVNTIAAGTLTVGGKPVAAHCQVTGAMHKRVSPVDGKTYAIGFEMRLPLDWNGRFFYQANGGLDGVVPAATRASPSSVPTPATTPPRRCSASTRRRASTMATRPWASSRRWPRR
jgi:feruloyl esterase